MVNRQKIIGVCLSQSHTFLKTNFLSELDLAARKEGCSVVVFNSSMDYYWAQNGARITDSVYKLISYDMLVALVILAGDIHDTQMQEEIIRKANLHRIPVILQGDSHPSCISILCDYEDAYKTIIRHVVEEHGAKDTFFLAGIEDEVNSQRRLRYWQEVMKDAGLPCQEDRIAYANYTEADAQRITENRILVRQPVPDAVFCANDGMAAAVCDTLQKHGLRVPEDVIVTGFDGTVTAYLSKPQLTTCDSDYQGQAALIMEQIRRFYQNGENDTVHKHPFRPVLAASCGKITVTVRISPSFFAKISPPCSSTIFFAIASPKPALSASLRASSPR